MTTTQEIMSIQSGDIIKVSLELNVDLFISLPNTHTDTLTRAHIHTHTLHHPLPVPPAWRYIGACVGVIVELHCRNLAAVEVWRAAPR